MIIHHVSHGSNEVEKVIRISSSWSVKAVSIVGTLRKMSRRTPYDDDHHPVDAVLLMDGDKRLKYEKDVTIRTIKWKLGNKKVIIGDDGMVYLGAVGPMYLDKPLIEHILPAKFEYERDRDIVWAVYEIENVVNLE